MLKGHAESCGHLATAILTTPSSHRACTDPLQYYLQKLPAGRVFTIFPPVYKSEQGASTGYTSKQYEYKS